MSEIKLEEAVLLPSGFRFGEVSSLTALRAISSSVPSLGPLADFTGTFTGNGFNTIFRPDSPATPTPLPIPVSGSDNVLELNLTADTISFSKSIGSVPNRGMVQGDIFLNGVPYLQTVSDITIPSQPTGIHLEPGLWMIAPPTTDPAEGTTLVRMASIPHGTTVVAQPCSPATLSEIRRSMLSVSSLACFTDTPGLRWPITPKAWSIRFRALKSESANGASISAGFAHQKFAGSTPITV